MEEEVAECVLVGLVVVELICGTKEELRAGGCGID